MKTGLMSLIWMELILNNNFDEEAVLKISKLKKECLEK